MGVPNFAELPEVANEPFAWENMPIGSYFRTAIGFVYKRLPCGHFRNEAYSSERVRSGSDDYCWQGCHERA